MNNPVVQLSEQEKERRKKNALAISLTTGILFAILTAIIGPVAYRQNGIDGLWGIALTGIVSLAAFIGALQVFRGSTVYGIGILIATILIMACTLPFVSHGQGLALGIMVLIVVSSISSATLPPIWAIRTIMVTLIITILIVLTDLYLPDFGLPTNPLYTNVIAAITTLVYIFFILRSINSYTLQTKIVIFFTLITITPLVTLGFFYSRSLAQVLQNQGKTQLTTLANITASKVDGFITSQLDSILTDTKQLALISYLELPEQSRAGSEEEANARLTLLSLTRKDPVFIHSIALLDINGINIMDTGNEHQGRNEADFPYFSKPFQTGLPYASNIVFDNDDEPELYFSAPVKNRGGITIGVLRVEYHATVIQALVRSVDPRDSGTIISLVDVNTYMRTAYTGNRDRLFRSYKNFTDLEVAALQAEQRLPTVTKELLFLGADEKIVAGIDNLQQQPFFNDFSQSLDADATNTGVFLETQPWVALVHQSTANYLEPVKEQNKATILISLLLVILSIAVGFFASQILTGPLVSLTKTAEQIAAGDRTVRAHTNTEDEIGMLSASFNRMTDELNQTFNSLEARVAERTADLEIARRQSDKRADELQAVSEISKIITGEQKFENLLLLVTRLVSDRFGFYHIGIFLLDETGQFAVLQAANSEGGKIMLDRGHRLEVGGSGIVGYVAQTGAPRIALDVGQDAAYFDNPDLPNTRSEMALPLSLRNKVMGVLDIQSEKPGAFTENDTKIFNILADQISTALENARLFTQTQQALNEAQALYRQNLKEGWSTFSREESVTGYRQNMKGGNKLTEPIESDEIRQAVNRGNSLIFHADGIAKEATIVVPIKIRGQVIGSLNIKAPNKGRQWSGDEVNLAEMISERLSIALENARLIQESQRQVIKEQTISEVTGKIGASINLKNVLQTAVEELGRAMPGSEVVIQFKSDDK